jgi:hypothetical protein
MGRFDLCLVLLELPSIETVKNDMEMTYLSWIHKGITD